MDGIMSERASAHTVITNGIFQQVPWEQMPLKDANPQAVV